MPPMPPQPAAPSALFPTYLLPSLPFRRRKSSTDSTSSTSSTLSDTASTDDSQPHQPTYLSTHTSHLRCTRCAADLALSTQIISKGFQGRHGRAYLVAPQPSAHVIVPPRCTAHRYATARAKNDALPNLPNTYTHRPVPRQLVTGAHTVSDISCAVCDSVLGWKYVSAEEEGQRYKVGKFILETRKVCRTALWEGDGEAVVDETAEQGRRSSAYRIPPNELSEAVEFDSEDEDECDDLFLGVWTPELAMKRRKAKQFERFEE